MTKISENGHGGETELEVKEPKTKTAKEKKGTSDSSVIELPELNTQKVTFKIKGLTPLIVSKFSEKAKQMMLDKQMKKAKTGKEAKDPKQQYNDSIYFFPDGKRTGFPAVGFKAAMVRGAKQLGMNMTDSRGMFHVLADPDGNGLVEIKGKHEMRDDMVRLATGVADVRFRAEYKSWSANVTILFNANAISKEQVASILRQAGFSCGIGEWRPEKSNSGQFGMFELASEE